jgi:hypothetical protein
MTVPGALKRCGNRISCVDGDAMSYFLRILCRSDAPVTADDVEEFVREGVYFDPDPEFSRAPAGTDESDPLALTIRYAPRKRPVILSGTGPGPELDEELADIREQVANLPPDVRGRIQSHLDQTRQVIAIEVDRDRLTEDAWDMLDHLQAHLASVRDGILYAPDDGFYDAELQPIGKF